MRSLDHAGTAARPVRIARALLWSAVAAALLTVAVRWLTGILGSAPVALVLVGVALLTVAPFAGDRGSENRGRHNAE